jgi:hypothetical protein
MASASSRPLLMLATLSLLTLTGCFDVVQELWINPDGSARLMVDVALPKSLGMLAQAHGGKSLVDQLHEQRKAAQETLSKNPDVQALVMRQYDEGDVLHLVHELTVKDATKLPELYRQVWEDSTRDQQQAAGDWDFRVEREGGNYIVTQRFTPATAGLPSSTGQEDLTEQLAKDLAKGMTKALFANHHVTLRIHGPGIGETNGTVNEKKDTVEWKVPLAELVDGPKEGRELRAVVHGGEPLWLWPVVIGIPLAVLGLAISAARKRRAFAGR